MRLINQLLLNAISQTNLSRFFRFDSECRVRWYAFVCFIYEI